MTTQPFIRIIAGKGGRDRVCPLTKKALETLQDYLKHRPMVPFEQIFVGFNPVTGYMPLDRHCVARRFRTISLSSGIPFTAHSLRHWRISTLARDNKLSLPMIQKLVGHGSLAVTEGYINLTDSDLFEAFNRLA